MEVSRNQALPSATAPIGYRPRYQDQGNLTGIGLDLNDQSSLSSPPGASRQPGVRLSEMSWRDRHGLKGLAARLDPENPEYSELAVGTDLSMLGFNFDGESPLYSTFGTPFGPLGIAATRLAIPDYKTPDCYQVHKVPPLETKLNAFSDEALFCVFYSMPRDFAQERAAEELYRREWRWNINRRQWMRKDDTAAPPIRLSQKTERGVYIVWNADRWERQSTEVILNYDDLEQRFSDAPAQTGIVAGGM